MNANNAAPTPGTWSVYEDCARVAADGAAFIAHGTMGEYKTESITDQLGNFYNPADARLVAAPKELLEALRKFYAHYPMGINSFLDEAARMARSAISKATGESI